MNSYIRPFAIVTGASTGIGYELPNVAPKMASTCWSPPTSRRLTKRRRTFALSVLMSKPSKPTSPPRRGARNCMPRPRGDRKGHTPVAR
jgi:hypothetical protein